MSLKVNLTKEHFYECISSDVLPLLDVCLVWGVLSKQPASVWLHRRRWDSTSNHQHQTVHHVVWRENKENQRHSKAREDTNTWLWLCFLAESMLYQLRFGWWDMDVFFSRTGGSSFRACFSFHSSYSEVLTCFYGNWFIPNGCHKNRISSLQFTNLLFLFWS